MYTRLLLSSQWICSVPPLSSTSTSRPVYIEYAGNSNGARACAAGQRFPRAALPHAHADLGGRDNLDKFRVRAFGEQGWYSKSGPIRGKSRSSIPFMNITACGLPIDTAVISYSWPFTSTGRATKRCWSPSVEAAVSTGIFCGGQFGFAHVNGSAADFASLNNRRNNLHSCAGLDRDHIFN